MERSMTLRRMDESEVGRPHGRLRLRNLIAGSLDARVQPLYDYWAVAKNTAVRQETLFQIAWGAAYTPAGGTQFNKTYYHTNLTGSGGSLPAPNKLLVKNVSIMTRPDMHPADVIATIGQYVAEFNTLQKTFWRGHNQKLPAGAGAFISGINNAAVATTAEVNYSASNGWPSAQNTSPLVMDTPAIQGAQVNPILGVLLEQQQPFYLQVDPTLTQATVYTTNNDTAANTGFTPIGIIAWGYLEGIQLVAIV
jgi:hypothetical protein